MFIISAIQHIKIGDLSTQKSGLSLSSDAPGEGLMDVDEDEEYGHLPGGTDVGDSLVLSRSDERSLVRDSTASFAGNALSHSKPPRSY